MYDVAIVGGGPAGASAATFTSRAGLQTVVIDADAGMTRRAMVNNHLGFPEGVTGPDLVDNGKLQAARAGAEIVDVDREGRSNVPGVWAAGTIAGASVHTIITSGDGARVAVNLISGTKGERHVDHDALPRPSEVHA